MKGDPPAMPRPAPEKESPPPSPDAQETAGRSPCALPAIAAALTGAGAVPAFAPLGWFPLAFVSLALLVALLERAKSARAGFGLGLAWGLGAFGGGISWLYVVLERYGGMHPLLAALAVFLFCVYLALYPAMAGALYMRWRHGGALRRGLSFAAAWLLAEWLRGTLFTGFPWLSIGYAQTPPSPLAGYFALAGVYGVGALTAFIAALAALCAGKSGEARQAALPAVAAVALVLAGGWGLARHAWVEPDGEPLSVSLLQPNIAPSLKWNPAHLAGLLRINADLVRAARGDVVVLPETALPSPLDWLPEGYIDALAGLVGERGGALITGAFIREDGHYRNAAVTLGTGGGQRYAKRHLVPFGEYSPPLFGWFYRLINLPMSQQIPGAREQAPFLLHGRRIALNICYEDVFGAELISGLPQAGLMLNLSNLAWYGDSFAQPQHLQIARARALESGRPMLRSTNTGMTALVLPDGSVPAALPAFSRGILEIEVPAYRGGTPYARWGDALALVAAIAALSILALSRWPRIAMGFPRCHRDV